MALTFEQQRPVEFSLIGVGLIIVPPRDTVTNIPWTGQIEIERAPDASGSPGTWVPIATLEHVPPAGGRFIDDRPWTTAVWWYRYRPVRGGASGSYSAAVSATPGLFPRGTRAGFQTGDAATFYAGVRGDPMSDEKFAVAASANDGLTAEAAVKESGGKEVRRLLAKPLAADPDTADSVGDGTSKRVTTVNEATGAGRAYDAIDGSKEIGRVAPSTGDLVINGEFERGVANWRVTSGGEMESTTTSPIGGAKSLRITAVNSTTHRVQQCDRTTDVNDSADGNPLYTSVNAEDEVFVEARVAASLASIELTYRIGVEEYDTSKTLVQRTVLATIAGGDVLGAVLIRGGAGLQATTRFIVPYLELVVGSTGGGVVTRWDTVRCFVIIQHEHCKVYRSGVLNLSNGTETAILWDAEDHDIGNPAPGMHNLSSNQALITVKQGGYGKVELRGQIQFDAGATGYRRLRIRKNGATILAEVEVMAVTTASIPTTLQIGITDRRPATGDDYEILATQTNGGSLGVVAGIGASFLEAIHRPY